MVSIGHRSTLEAFPQRNVKLSREGDGFVLQEATTGAKAS
jgi:putative ATP-binding cassette transporter